MNDEIREEREGKRIGIFAVQVYLLFHPMMPCEKVCAICFIHGEAKLISQTGE
jgi:hypothetical protein